MTVRMAIFMGVWHAWVSGVQDGIHVTLFATAPPYAKRNTREEALKKLKEKLRTFKSTFWEDNVVRPIYED